MERLWIQEVLSGSLIEAPGEFDADELNELLVDAVEDWHGSQSTVSLHDYLGLTWAEYVRWVRDSDAIECIVRARAQGVESVQ